MKVATEVGNDEVQLLGTTPDQENKREDQNQDFDNFDLAKKCDLFDNSIRNVNSNIRFSPTGFSKSDFGVR